MQPVRENRHKETMTIDIEYKETKDFTKADVETLFLSVDWLSGRYPDRLLKALKQSSYVLTAWHDGVLVGLLRVLDDGCMTAFLHYLLVRPEYQGMGIAFRMLEQAKERYRDYLYFDLMPDEKSNVSFYTRHGFEVLENGTAMQIRHL